jgi:hypothetical protein
LLDTGHETPQQKKKRGKEFMAQARPNKPPNFLIIWGDDIG